MNFQELSDILSTSFGWRKVDDSSCYGLMRLYVTRYDFHITLWYDGDIEIEYYGNGVLPISWEEMGLILEFTKSLNQSK